jgi:hypothetical protein
MVDASWSGYLVDDFRLDKYARGNLLLHWAAVSVLFSIAIILARFVSNLWIARGVKLVTPAFQIGIATRARLAGHSI